jgi:small GTP-binding protein
VNSKAIVQDEGYQQAIASVQKTLDKLRGCRPEERQRLQQDFLQMQEMLEKLNNGRVEIVVFGEISTGKSALINALIGEQVAEVDVQGGWTKEVAQTAWQTCEYQLPGFAESSVVLADTPGINEVQGEERAAAASQAASRADLILFVTDSDLNEIEHAALMQLVGLHKPVIVVLNKADLYSRAQRERLLEVLRHERLRELVPGENVILAAADPREVEYVIEGADGRTRNEWRKPAPDVEDLKARILEILEREGLALVTLSAAMFTADKSDRIAALRVRLRETRANQTILSYAVVKAAAVALTPIPIADVAGGAAVDATMVVNLASIYGLELSWTHAQRLVSSILGSAGLVTLGELFVHFTSSAFKTLTLGAGTVLTALPQGAAAGFGSYIVGHAAKYYFEHGASWGKEGPKHVVKQILATTDKQSVLQHLKQEIQRKLLHNPHAAKK